jgi:hypothetical protein
MKSFFEGKPICRYIIYPIELLRSLELESWFAVYYQLALHDYLCSSNGILVLQLKLHDDNGEETKILQRTFFK